MMKSKRGKLHIPSDMDEVGKSSWALPAGG